MAISKPVKIVLIVLAVAVLILAVAPMVVKGMMRNQIVEKLRDEFGDKVTFGTLDTSFSPLTATLTKVEFPSPVAGSSAQLVTIDKIVMHLNSNSLSRSAVHIEELNVTGFHARISVDERGESSFSRFIRELPPSKRTTALPIDRLTVDGLDFTTTLPNATAAESLITVKKVVALNYVIPPPGKLLGNELWTDVAIDGIEASSPAALGTLPAASPVDGKLQGSPRKQPSIRVGMTTFELAQAASLDTPVRLRKFKAEQAECFNDYVGGNARTAIQRTLDAIQQSFGVKEPADIKTKPAQTERPHGTGLLIEDLSIASATVETRGDKGDGSRGYWRLKGAQIDATQLAFGAETKSATPGTIKVSSATEAHSGPGRLELSITNLIGAYPKSSFTCTYHIDNLPARVFNSNSAASEMSGIQRGTLTMDFAGTATDGNLNIDGSVTLSNDFEVSGDVLKRVGVKLIRGEPLKPVTIRGTLESPQISIPKDLAFMQDMMGTLIFGGPIAIADTVFGKVPVVGPVISTGLKEVKKGLGIFGKIGDVFDGDKKK